MLRIYHLKCGMQLQLSKQMKARQKVYLDYASRRLEGRPYTADPEHREIPEIVAWADKEARIENRWLIRRFEGMSVRGAPEPTDFLPQVIRSPFEKTDPTFSIIYSLLYSA